MFFSGYKSKETFLNAWKNSVAAMGMLHENHLILPDYRYELHHEALQKTLDRPSCNEIQKVLRKFWQFDERFWGELFVGDKSQFSWAVYALSYLGQDRVAVQLMLDAYLPLLGDFAVKEFGRDFSRKVCATFFDDVSSLLWDVQGAEPPPPGDWFDWHAHLNEFPSDLRTGMLASAGLRPLKHPSFPTLPILQFMVSDRVRMGNPTPRDLRRSLIHQYKERGYTF